MIITTATLDALRVTFEKRFSEAYSATPNWGPELATEIPSASKENIYGWIAQQTKMREWVGPRVALNLKEHDYTLRNLDYEATIELDRNDIEDDNLGLFTSVTIPQLAQAAKKHPDQLLKTMLQSNSGAGPTAFDGRPLFDDSHPTFAGAGTYDNNFAVALTADNFEANWAAMASYTGEDGEPLGVMPNKMIVPPQLRRTALAIVQASSLAVVIKESGANVAAASVDNVMKGWVDVIVVPEFANDPTRWYLADTTKAIKPLIIQNRRADQFVTRDNPQDPKVFDQRKFTYGVDNRRNVGVSLPFLISTSKP
jgi:phage major head subunit gpT-like protein